MSVRAVVAVGSPAFERGVTKPALRYGYGGPGWMVLLRSRLPGDGQRYAHSSPWRPPARIEVTQPISEHGTLRGGQVVAHLEHELDAEPLGVGDQVGERDDAFGEHQLAVEADQARTHRSTSNSPAGRTSTAVATAGFVGFADGLPCHPGARSGIAGKTASPRLSLMDNETNPSGYCGLGGTGVSCPIGLAATS